MTWDGHHLWIGNYGPAEPGPDWIYMMGNTETLGINYKITT